MQRFKWIILMLMITCLQLAACGQAPAEPQPASGPATVERITGTDISRVTLTVEAAKRLGVETAPVRDTQVRGALHKVVPYSSVLYDLHGETWVYTSPSDLTYVRESITVDFIEGDLAVLVKGPPSGTLVVTVGTSELYGTEFGVGQ
jgi:hypothetical protein